MSGKQHKRELKRAKEAARAAARQAERRRTLMTVGIILAVVAAGAGVVFFTVQQEAQVAAEADATPTPSPGEATPTQDSRPVACGADEPANVGEVKSTYTEPEQVLVDDTDYQAVIETSCGRIVMDLDERRAPETVNSYVFLAQQGFFDGLEIFRNAASIGALQTGAGNNTNTWQLGYMIADELEAAEADGYPAGSVAMANSATPDSAGSQFFFVYNDSFVLPPTYARFATVTEGLDVLETIGAIPVTGEAPNERIYMDSVQITTADAASTEAEPTASEATETPSDTPSAQATSTETPSASESAPGIEPSASPS